MADLTPQTFVERWDRVTLSERSSYQQHFLDLCDLLDEPKPAASDETGSLYTFEKRVEKTGGGIGFTLRTRLHRRCSHPAATQTGVRTAMS